MRPVGSNPTAPSSSVMGRSHSGLVRRFAKPLGGQPPRGFESLPPRQDRPQVTLRAIAIRTDAVCFMIATKKVNKLGHFPLIQRAAWSSIQQKQLVCRPTAAPANQLGPTRVGCSCARNLSITASR